MATLQASLVEGFTLQAQSHPLLNKECCQFLVALQQQFNNRRKQLLSNRVLIQNQLDNGVLPTFLSETTHIRQSEWKVSPVPQDIQDRRVEITGPVDRKMIINALNSGAKVFMADFEDSNSPFWVNNIDGQQNLYDAIRRTISYTNTENGKVYSLNEKTATLFVRPRGLHMEEKHILINGEYMSASLFDFGVFFFYNAKELLAENSGPYFYLPKLEHYLEARWWNDVFIFAQNYISLPLGTIKATVLIETILASFQLNEILWELKDHSAGLNCGRWDYIFSFIKKFRNHKQFCLPDRSKVTMTVPFMKNYSHLVIQTCHKRGAHAMGGMAAQIPIKNNEQQNNEALSRVKADKEREVLAGHDGTWVAHPGLVPIAMTIFNQYMPTPNQVHKQLNITITDQQLLEIPQDTITENGLRLNINVGILYIEAWLRGNGAVAIYNLMEDAATAEISRTQVWQWIKHECQLDNGTTITLDLVKKLLLEELEKIKPYVGEKTYHAGEFERATNLFMSLIVKQPLEDFLTTPAYNMITL